MGKSAKTAMSRRSFLVTSATMGGASGLPMGATVAQALTQDRPPPVGSGQWLATTCAGCTTFCAKQVYVQDGRALHVRGNEFCKTTGKAGCARQYLALQELYDQDRVRVPLRRTNPKKGRNEDPRFVPISWDEALDIVSKEIKRAKAVGPGAICVANGSHHQWGNLGHYLSAMVEHGGSDLFLSAGTPAGLKVQGTLRRLQEEPLSA
mgnify:CR=1 FL=1